MKTINSTTRFAFFMLMTSAFVVLQSCVSYYPASYVSDGIYVRSDNRAYQTYSNGSSFYSSYFAGKAAQWENNNTDYEITNSDDYTGNSNPAWGQNPQSLSINVYNSPAWGWGGYDPFFYDYMYHYDHWTYNGRFFDTVGTILGTLIADGEDLIGHGDGTEIHFTSIRTAIMLGDGDTTHTYITIHTGTVSIEEI